MKKELLFPQDCDGEQYLRRLIDAYPYDIEEARVLALLTAQPHPSPYLLEFLTYAATLSKFRLCSSEAARNPSLDTLFQNMAVLKQKDNSLLHMQPFGFDATLQLRVCEVSHPMHTFLWSRFPLFHRYSCIMYHSFSSRMRQYFY